MLNKCEVCGIEFESKKAAKTCSPKCRVTLSRFGVTKDPSVTLAAPTVTRDVTFKFRTNGKIREAKYWYDVPLAGSPVLQEGWPKMPSYINVRQYFLWWKNEFKVGTGESPFDGPILHNPFRHK